MHRNNFFLFRATISILFLLFMSTSLFAQKETNKISIENKYLNIKEKKAFVKLQGSTFSTEMETDWNYYNPTNPYIDRGACPKQWFFYGKFFPGMKFGLNKPWEYISDLSINESDNGIVTVSKGYQTVVGHTIPYLKITRSFWNKDEMLYEVSESNLTKDNHYVIAADDSAAFTLSADRKFILYSKNDIVVAWQFSPLPGKIVFNKEEGYMLTFDTNRVETLMRWGKKESFKLKPFNSVSAGLNELTVTSAKGESRIYPVIEKQQCVEPGESIRVPQNEYMLTSMDSITGKEIFVKQGLHELVTRKASNERIEMGNSTFFSMNMIVESKSTPDLKNFLVRTLRSLKDRIIFDVVTEDDPTQNYIWGTGTWPRCFSILCLDYFGFHDEAYNYLDFMLNASRQFEFRDKYAHLWDSFFMTGERREVYYDINGHSIKLFEAGKFYLNHRNDIYGKMLLDNHYQTLKDWCSWIEEHMEKTGLVLDLTESNVWNYGYGVFTQAPAIAGIKLFTEMAKDKDQNEDVIHFSKVVDSLMTGMNNYLYGDCENHFLKIPKGTGKCYITCIPNEFAPEENRIGLSCYSLAPDFFLCDPDVNLVDRNDPKITTTLNLALQYLGDVNDRRIISWHVKNNISHIGYGQGQLLMALVYANRPEEFNRRLEALFDITKSSIGDKYLIPEIFGRPRQPNKGNKAQITYYPYVIAYLGGLNHNGVIDKTFIKDLEVHKQ